MKPTFNEIKAAVETLQSICPIDELTIEKRIERLEYCSVMSNKTAVLNDKSLDCIMQLLEKAENKIEQLEKTIALLRS